MNNMFCFQCEQTAKGEACVVSGVCGKKPPVANKQDELIAALINLARRADGKSPSEEASLLMLEGLFTTITNVSFDENRIAESIREIEEESNKLPEKELFDWEDLWIGNEDIISLRSTLLLGLKGMAAYAHHAWILGKKDSQINDWFFKGMKTFAEDADVNEWLDLLMEFGHMNLRAMELLDEANTSAYGHPLPVKVSMKVEKGPFIVVTGHDLHDLKQLLEQTEGKGVDIYTHGEMLPCHGYPELKKHQHLKGNFGTAWQNQQKEFDNLPAPILFTTNCLMPPKPSYADRVFTTSVVAYPEMQHIAEGENFKKDFTPLIEKALELGGYKEDKEFFGINGGSELMTGFARNAVLENAGLVVDSVKNGDISHFFLVGGCDGAKPGRNYYTDFVKESPEDSIILTLACGKYRFNDLDLGEINGLPRILDMGQCNDAYSAIKVAEALAEAFDCEINQLPLSMVLSWYEQKAVCILLTLLALGIEDIYLGPTLPAFISENVLEVLVEKFGLKPTTSAEEDLKAILA